MSNRLLPVLLLAAIAVTAVWLRELHAAGWGAPNAAGEAEWYVDDPDAAYHLRRIELALLRGDVPDADRFLAHPEGSAVPWPPFFDGLLAFVARTALRVPEGGPVDERELEAFLVHVPPVLGGLTCVALFLATFAVTRGVRTPRLWASLVAAAVYAVTPIAIWYGGVTRVDHHVFTALLLALHVASVAMAVRAKELTDATLGALVGGLLSGLLLLSWLAAGVFVGVGGLVLLARALARDPDDEGRARDGARAGLLYFLAAGATVMVPAASSPWNEVRPGSLLELTDGVTRALFGAAVPFLLIGLEPLRRRPPVLRLAVALASTALVVVLLPGFLSGVRDGLDWAGRHNLFMSVVAESRPLLGDGGAPAWMEAARDLTPLFFAYPLAWLWLLRDARRPEGLLVLLLGAALLAMSLSQRRFANTFAVPLAIGLAAALHGGWSATARVGVRRALAGLGIAAVALAAGFGARALGAVTEADLEDVRDWRAEVVGGLRWMREGTPVPGPWSAPQVAQDYGVLSAWGLGHLIEYHARRPTIATNFGSFVGERGFVEAARALLTDDEDELAVLLHRMGARYVVVTPRQAGDVASLTRIAGLSQRERSAFFERHPSGAKVFSARARASAVWRLAVYPPDAPPEAWGGLRRVYASERRETVRGARPRAGEPSGPVISIYELVRADDREPTIGPR